MYFITVSCVGVIYIYLTPHCTVIVIVAQLPSYPAQCQIVASQDSAKLRLQIKIMILSI